MVILYIFDVYYFSYQEIESVIDHTSKNECTPDRNSVATAAPTKPHPLPMQGLPTGRDDDSQKYQGLTKVKEMKGTNFARLFIALHTMATSLHPAINL